MRAVTLGTSFAALALLSLSGCTPGGQLAGIRGPADSGCGGINVTAGGGGQVGVMPPGAIGEEDVTSTGCTIKITGWVFAPNAVTMQGNVAAMAPSTTGIVAPTPPVAPTAPSAP